MKKEAKQTRVQTKAKAKNMQVKESESESETEVKANKVKVKKVKVKKAKTKSESESETEVKVKVKKVKVKKAKTKSESESETEAKVNKVKVNKAKTKSESESESESEAEVKANKVKASKVKKAKTKSESESESESETEVKANKVKVNKVKVKKAKSEESKNDSFTLRNPISPNVLRQVVSLALEAKSEQGNAIVKLLVTSDKLEPGHKRTRAEEGREVNAVVLHVGLVDATANNQAWATAFHALDSVGDVLRMLVQFSPNFPAFSEFAEQRPNPTGVSTTPLYRKGSNFVEHTTERVTSKSRLKSEYSLEVNGERKSFAQDAVRTLLSPKFVCAGKINEPHLPCAHGVGVMDNSNGTEPLKDFILDHAIAFSEIKDLHTAIRDKMATPKQLEKILLAFIQHLFFSTCPHPIYGWPPNVYCRCGECNRLGNEALGRVHETPRKGKSRVN